MMIAPVVVSTSRKNTPNLKNNAPQTTPAFTGKTSMFKSAKNAYNKGWDKFIENGIINPVLKPIINSDKMAKFANWSANIDNLPSHMSTAGSIVTTYFYANRTKKTLNKDEEQKKRAKTLMLNQWMVTGVSTALGYGANGLLNKVSKNMGYKFREVNQGHPKLTARMKGFDIAKQLLIFTMMYRYVAPVFVTPVASKVSKWWEARKSVKTQEAKLQANTQPVQPNNQNQVKTNNVA